MKKTIKIIAVLLILSLIFEPYIYICRASDSEEDILIDNLYFKILNDEEKTVEVIGVYNSDFISRVDIPSSIMINENNYTVTSIRGFSDEFNNKYDGAFDDCVTLKTITIPDTVTNIGDMAFSGCSALTNIIIPDSIINIGKGAFMFCSSLESVIIPDTITSIKSFTFCGCSSLKSVTLPDTITSIGENSFSQCSSLTSIMIPSSVESIGENAFWYCESLTNIIIPNSVKIIGIGAFQYCKSLTNLTIPNSVTFVGYDAFKSCEKLTSIEIPGYIDNVKDVFEQCDNLTSVTILDGAENIKDNTFYSCATLTEIIIPNSVTSIGKNAFMYCPSLKSIRIPDNVKSIGEKAFWQCTSLTNIVIPDSVTNIGEDAFGYCISLTSITIPGNMKNYGNAFSNNKKLRSAIISEGSTIIEDNLLSGCRSLTDITIPNSVTSIGKEAFYNCSSLTNITIPDSVTNIGDNAFKWCSSLINIIIPDKVTNIGKNSFEYCYGLTNVILPKGITQINGATFKDCPNLENVIIPKNVKAIAVNAFEGCEKVVLNVYEGSYAEQFAKENNIEYKIIEENKIQFGTGKGSITIEESENTLVGIEISKSSNQYLEMKNKLIEKGYKNVYCACELDMSGDTSKGIELTFNVGTDKNDKEAMILHKLSDGSYEEFYSKIKNGKITINATYLSKFMLAFKETYNINVGETINIKVTDEEYNFAQWKFKDPSIAKITTLDGIEIKPDMYTEYEASVNVLGLKKGTLEVDLDELGSIFAGITINVTDNIKSIGFENANQEGTVGSTIKAQEVKYNPADTTDDKTVKWSLSNNEVANIDEKGNITCKKEGQTEVIAKVGEFTCKYTLNIKKNYIIGDVNQDQKVDSQDAVQVLKYVAHNISLDTTKLKAADTNKDGKVDSQDAVQILKYVAHNISGF